MAREKSMGTTLYYLFGLGLVVLAGVVFVLSNPPEVKGPPAGGPSTSGMPPGHPPTDGSPGMSPEQQAEMERTRKELEGRASEVKKLLEHDTSNDSLRLVLANYYYDLGRYTDAVPLYKEFLSRNPDDANARTDMAFCIANLNDVDGAIAELEKAVAADGRHQNAPYTLAMMYVAKRNQDSTVYWLNRVIEIDSTTQQAKNAALIIKEMTTAHSAPSSASQ